MRAERSAPLRRDVLDARDMSRQVLGTVREMDTLVRRRALLEGHAGTPFPRRTDRPRHEAAAAIGTDIEEPGLDAVRAERAFIAADAGVFRIRRQILVAIFAVRPQLQRHRPRREEAPRKAQDLARRGQPYFVSA